MNVTFQEFSFHNFNFDSFILIHFFQIVIEDMQILGKMYVKVENPATFILSRSFPLKYNLFFFLFIWIPEFWIQLKLIH